jgi:hypothetical protein
VVEEEIVEGEVVERVIERTAVAVAEEVVVEKGQNFPTGSTAHTHRFWISLQNSTIENKSLFHIDLAQPILA